MPAWWGTGSSQLSLSARVHQSLSWGNVGVWYTLSFDPQRSDANFFVVCSPPTPVSPSLSPCACVLVLCVLCARLCFQDRFFSV